MLPLAFALVVFNGFGISRLFLLWGVMYILTGWLYKVPVSVQPLKAMAVIAISSGISIEMLSGTSFFYGILLIVLSLTGAIRWLQKWFSPALVKGIQLGIGLILAQKAIEMVIEKGFLLFGEPGSMQINFLILFFVLTICLFPVKSVFAGTGGSKWLTVPQTDGTAPFRQESLALFYVFDLRDRETFLQFTYQDDFELGLPLRAHVQIFDVSNNCNENNFFDTFTPNDTHIYNMRDIQTNDGNPSGVVLPDDAYG
ncbi:MAG: putative sulfate/molybdate transporter, partial [Bacteroidetes bacterium]|nr:putative sulfate/molybdate transporter [Bacteroidota bacterium]